MSRLGIAPYLVAIAGLGVLLNFIIYPLAPRETIGMEPIWQDVEVVKIQPLSDKNLVLPSFLHQAAPEQSASMETPSSFNENELGQFQYAGKVYRLSALVTGSESAATLIDEAGEAKRLRIGDRLPGGGKVISIQINYIKLEESGGNDVTAEIYKRRIQ